MLPICLYSGVIHNDDMGRSMICNYTPANFVCGGYTVFTLSVCVRACVRPSVRPSVRNVLFP